MKRILSILYILFVCCVIGSLFICAHTEREQKDESGKVVYGGLFPEEIPSDQEQFQDFLDSNPDPEKIPEVWNKINGIHKSITNFTAFDGYFVAEIKDLSTDRFSLGWIRRQEGKSCYTVEDVSTYPFPPVERAHCFEGYEIDGEDYLFTQTGFYKVSRNAVEEVRSFPEQRYASVQYSHSLRAFLYIDLLDRSLYLDPLEGEARCICKGQFMEEGSASQGRNPSLPHLKEYPLDARLSQQMILYWYFHADGKRSLRICDLEGNILSETDRIDGLPCNPEWWGSGFLQEDALLFWRLETERDAFGNYLYTTHFTLYDQSLQTIKSLDIPYGVDPYSTLRRGPEDWTFYVIGSTSHEGATAIKEHAIEVRLDEGTYEVLAEEEFIVQIQPEKDRLYFLNTKDTIREVLR